MGRVLRLTPGFHASVRRQGLSSGTTSRRALSATIRVMLSAELPGPLDFEALIPPIRRAWVRRVSGCNLWVFYRFDADELRLVTLVTSPPVPVVEE